MTRTTALALLALSAGAGCKSDSEVFLEMRGDLSRAEARAAMAEGRADEAEARAEDAESRATMCGEASKTNADRAFEYQWGEMMATVADSNATKVLINQWYAFDEDCRGGLPDDPATDRACEARDMDIGARLDSLDLCFGRAGEMGAGATWHVCRPDSEQKRHPRNRRRSR